MASVACTLKSDVVALPALSEEEILSALSIPSLTNIIMSGFIRDNTLVSPLNRGRFYTCRSKHNQPEGVALIGHTVLFEAFSEVAIETFAAITRREASSHLLMGQHDAVQRFWSCYADGNQSPRHVCPITFLHCRQISGQRQPVLGLRPATSNDLEAVVQAQAAMAFETSGVDPLQKDPIGFRERYLRRIQKQRVWVLMQDDRLIFKLDVIADTPAAAYIEGVYVNPEERGKGLGKRCLTEVGRLLLARTNAIYLFVEDEDARAKSFYLKLGFNEAGQYDLLYF